MSGRESCSKVENRTQNWPQHLSIYLVALADAMMGDQDQTAVTAHLKKVYAEYRHTTELQAKARFFSPDCRQVCRPAPAFAATNRDTIMRYLRETSGKASESIQQYAEDPGTGGSASTPSKETTTGLSTRKTSFYTIRPLTGGEIEFGTDETAAPAGFGSATDIKLRADREGWVGMRVDLWDDEGEDFEGRALGILVKVQYWWKQDVAGEWLQILHDILYLGSRDGTEGNQEEILE